MLDNLDLTSTDDEDDDLDNTCPTRTNLKTDKSIQRKLKVYIAPSFEAEHLLHRCR